MENIRSIKSFRDMRNRGANLHPKSAQARFLQLPQVPEQAAKQCGACGRELPAKRLEMFGVVRYGPSLCSCQEDRVRKSQIEQRREEMLEIRNTFTYTWLGGRFTDASLATKTFENFDGSKQPKAYQAAMAFSSFLQGNLVLDGSYGTGKTHLLSAICNAALKNPKPTTSLFATSVDLFAAIQKRINDNEDFQGIIQRATSASLLVLDDIDKTKWTEWREEVYFSIVDQRTKRGLPMAISTNKLDELHLYTGGAVASRLKIGQIAIKMIGEDYRTNLSFS